MVDFELILKKAAENNASDMHFCVGKRLQVRIEGQLCDFSEDILTDEIIRYYADFIMNDEQKERLKKDGEVDFAKTVENSARLRCNVFMERNNYCIALRLLPLVIPTVEQIGTPHAVVEAAGKNKGLILVTGPTGHGKSTTLAALINYVNTHYKKHIITLEDPIEYVHPHILSVVNQREIGSDSMSFAAGLRAALRQDPDVILVGEMRDLETISTAITAAETGHLVFGTLHTNTAATTVDRVIDTFPAVQQQQIRIQLANVIECVVCQSLVPDSHGGRVAAYEVMTASNAVRNLIRENKSFQITSTMQTSKRIGMQTMDDALYDLYQSRRISREMMLAYAIDANALATKIHREF